jgi:uracil-DNA glycosylase family 4
MVVGAVAALADAPRPAPERELVGRGVVGRVDVVALAICLTLLSVGDDGEMESSILTELRDEIVDCGACDRLVAWRTEVAETRRAAYRDQQYWGRPVPGFGDPAARIVVLGLAPAAHGANRTGRVFTGDRSGDWLFAAMHRAGLANQPTSTAIDDGLELTGAWVTAAVKCAPPKNRPTPDERDRCSGFLEREFAALSEIRVVVCLGAFGYEAACRLVGISPRPRFGHGLEVTVPDGPALVASFHPSQQNTFTGRLTVDMLDEIFQRAVELAR